MTTNLGFIKPRTLSPDEKACCVKQMVAARELIQSWCIKLYGDGKKTTQFRRDFFAKRVPGISREESAQIESLESVAAIMLAGYVRQIASIARRFESRYNDGLSYDDLFQEGCAACYDMVFAYDGSTEFSTFLHWGVRNRLLDAIRRSESQLSPPSQDIQRLKRRVSSLMNRGYSLDAAIIELELSPSEAENARHIMAEVNSSLLEGIAVQEDKDYEDYSLLWRAVAQANLTALERDVFNAYLEGESGFQSKVASRHRNSRTHQPLTRAAAGLAFQRAKAKVRESYTSLFRQAA